MPLPKQNILLFNGAAALLIGGSLLYMLQSQLIGESLPPEDYTAPAGSQIGRRAAFFPALTLGELLAPVYTPAAPTSILNGLNGAAHREPGLVALA